MVALLEMTEIRIKLKGPKLENGPQDFAIPAYEFDTSYCGRSRKAEGIMALCANASLPSSGFNFLIKSVFVVTKIGTVKKLASIRTDSDLVVAAIEKVAGRPVDIDTAARAVEDRIAGDAFGSGCVDEKFPEGGLASPAAG